MKAVVKVRKGEGNVEIQDVEEPRVGPSEVKIEVKTAGICGTDIHIYHDEFKSNPPVILGHEFCGVVKEVEGNVTEFKAGDRVTSETAARVCGKCMFCRTGDYNLCPERLGLGYGVKGKAKKQGRKGGENLGRLLAGTKESFAREKCQKTSFSFGSFPQRNKSSLEEVDF